MGSMDFQSIALPTELPGRAAEIARAGGAGQEVTRERGRHGSRANVGLLGYLGGFTPAPEHRQRGTGKLLAPCSVTCLTHAFWSRVDRTERGGGCWEWTGTFRQGYGVLSHAGLIEAAHRLAVVLAGHVPSKELFACHKCNNRGCVRVGPGHLYAGSALENVRDAVAAGRRTPILEDRVDFDGDGWLGAEVSIGSDIVFPPCPGCDLGSGCDAYEFSCPSWLISCRLCGGTGTLPPIDRAYERRFGARFSAPCPRAEASR